MTYLKTMIKNELEKDKTLATKLASIGGFKNATPLYKFLNDPVREMDNLGCLVKMLEYLYGEDVNKILNEYFKTINMNNKFARQALEYAAFNGLEVRDELINKMKECNNAESREWAIMYDIFRTLSQKPLQNLKTLSEITVKTEEMSALKLIMQLCCYYYLDDIHMVEIITKHCEHEILNIKNEYIKCNYQIRLWTVFSILYLYKNRLQESRDMIERILSICTRSYTFASAYQTLGMSYLYDDFETGEKHLLKSLEYYRKTPQRYDGDIHSSLNLNRAYWNKPLYDLRVNGKVFDKHDAIMYFVRSGENNKAEKLLQEIDESSLNLRDKAFQYYSKGIVYDSLSDHYKSIKYFKKLGDRFYLNLPVIELRKKSFDNDLLDLIII